MVPCGYTDQEWKKLGVKSVGEITPAVLNKFNGSKEDVQVAKESNDATKKESTDVVAKQQTHGRRPRAKKK